MNSQPANPALVADPIVEVDRVTKWFGPKVAVSEVSCSFGPGVSGLLGPNGAGKTTMLRMLTGLLEPSEGEVRVLGHHPRKHPVVYRDVGLVPEEHATYPRLTALQYVAYAARLSGVEDVTAAATEAIDTVGLSDEAHRRLGGFSKGMRQRAKVAAALVHGPDVLVLDEPLNGTDPVQRVHLIGLFRRLGEEGHTVVVSSHILEEVERMADRVLAMVDGKLAAAGDIAAIRRAMTDIPYRVHVETDEPRRLAAALLGEGVVHGVSLADGAVKVETDDLSALGTRLPAVARDLGTHISAFRPEDESLESVFRYLVEGR